jgi:hypothetical protein
VQIATYVTQYSLRVLLGTTATAASLYAGGAVLLLWPQQLASAELEGHLIIVDGITYMGDFQSAENIRSILNSSDEMAILKERERIVLFYRELLDGEKISAKSLDYLMESLKVAFYEFDTHVRLNNLSAEV